MNTQSLLTGGLYPGSESNTRSLLTGGLADDTIPFQSPQDNPSTIGIDSVLSNNQRQSFIAGKTPGMTLTDPYGSPVSTDGQAINLGSSVLFAPDASQAFIQPPLNSKEDQYRPSDDQAIISYAGSDMRVFLELTNPSSTDGPVSKQLIELVTISVSVHREKTQVRSLGYINPRGFARGSRTIAGTMILTQFMVDVLYRFLDLPSAVDLSKDSIYQKPDQLPPFNMMLVFSDEAGNASYRRLMGLEWVTDGTTYSAHNMLTEQTVSYYAADFTPLMPLHRTALMNIPAAQSLTAGNKTVKQVRQEAELVTTSITYD